MSPSNPEPAEPIGHSSQIEMHHTLGGMTLSVGQMGPEFLILDAPVDHPPTEADLFFSVDGHARERRILLPEGISKGSRRVRIASAS